VRFSVRVPPFVVTRVTIREQLWIPRTNRLDGSVSRRLSIRVREYEPQPMACGAPDGTDSG